MTKLYSLLLSLVWLSSPAFSAPETGISPATSACKQLLAETEPLSRAADFMHIQVEDMAWAKKMIPASHWMTVVARGPGVKMIDVVRGELVLHRTADLKMRISIDGIDLALGFENAKVSPLGRHSYAGLSREYSDVFRIETPSRWLRKGQHYEIRLGWEGSRRSFKLYLVDPKTRRWIKVLSALSGYEFSI